jgi:hypothetical protein
VQAQVERLLIVCKGSIVASDGIRFSDKHGGVNWLVLSRLRF